MSNLPHFIKTVWILAQFLDGAAARYNGFRHEAVDASNKYQGKRLEPIVVNYTITESCSASAPTRTIHSIVFPSPDASPVEITEQSQIITSFLPDYTFCVDHPIALLPVSGPPYLNQSTEYQTLLPDTGLCETVYASTTTTVCATTLTGIASKITVSDCDQDITFSSEAGFTLETPTPATTNFSLITPAPTVKRMKTFWVAPWQSLTSGEIPSDVDIKVCTIQDDDTMECTRYQEVWEVVVVTKTLTTTRDVQLTTTVSGPGTLIVETMQVHVTDTIETVDLSTSIEFETEVETESISKSKKLVTRTDMSEAVPSTIYITKHLKYKTSSPEPTTTIHMTSVATHTIVRTVTLPRPRTRSRPTFLELPDF